MLEEEFLKAAEQNDSSTLLELLKAKVDINTTNAQGATALHRAAGLGRNEVIKLLHKHGALFAVQDTEGWTPLHYALEGDKFDTAALLIKYERQLITITDDRKVSPLHFAVESKNLTIVEVLLQNGADPNAQDQNGETPLFWTHDCDKKMVTFLCKYGADPTYKNKKGRMAEDTARRCKNNEVADLLAQMVQEHTFYRQLRAQKKFFDPNRTKNKETGELLETFHHNRASPNKETTVVDVTDVPRRGVITADAGAVEKSLGQLSISDQKTFRNTAAIHRKLGWHSIGSGRGVFGHWEAIDTGVSMVNYQHRAQPGHLGNFFMAGVAEYGARKTHPADILNIINETTLTEPFDEKKQKENEKILAKLMIEHSKTGAALTIEILQQSGFQLFKRKSDNVTHLDRLNRVFYLISVKEIVRRMNQGARSSGTFVEEVPYATAYCRVLKLIAQGHLRMKDVFDKDASYGLPTGTKLSEPKAIAAIKIKLQQLNELYEEKNPTEDRISTELFHQELLEGYGGDSDTSGDEYSSYSSDSEERFSSSDEEESESDLVEIKSEPTLSPKP